METIAFLTGTWNITSFDYIDNEWKQGGSSKATFEQKLDGAVLQEAVKIDGPKYQLDMINTISFDPFAKQYNLASIDKKFSYIDLFEGEYLEQEQCLRFNNIKRGVPIKLEQGTMYFQVSWTRISNSKVIFLVESSKDGSATWLPESKIAYSRTQ